LAEYVPCNALKRDWKCINSLIEKPEWEYCMGELNAQILRERVDWIQLAQDTDQWRTSVNTVMDLKFPLNPRNSLTT
jgi:hypothetical protein